MARTGKGRIHLLDEIRGFAIVCMVLFHTFYTMTTFFDLKLGRELFNFFQPAVLWFAALFVLISGISSRLSHSNAKRGAKLLAVSVALSLVTWVLDAKLGMNGVVIWFGILHMLSLSMLIYAATHKVLDRIHPLIAIALFGLLFAVSFHLPDGYISFGFTTYPVPSILRESKFLFPFGILHSTFYSADYYPLLPWLFLFLIGTSVGRWFKGGNLPAVFYNEHIRPLAYCGRHSLIIYLLHQPIIYGVIWAAYLLIEQIKG